MMRLTILVAGMLALGSTAFAADLKLDEQKITYPADDANLDAYLVKPVGAGKHPAIVLIHDDTGLTDNIAGLAKFFAKSGFVVLAPNLASRPSTGAAAGMGRRTAVSRLDIVQTITDTDAAFKFLKSSPDVDAKKISAVGIGWGGWRIYKLAEDQPTLHRAVVFYGVTPDDGQLDDIKAPVLAHYAQGDFLITASSLITKKWLGKKLTYYVYPDSDHGFLTGGAGGIDLAAAAGEGVDLAALARKAAEETPKADPLKGTAAAAKLSLDRTLEFLKN